MHSPLYMCAVPARKSTSPGLRIIQLFCALQAKKRHFWRHLSLPILGFLRHFAPSSHKCTQHDMEPQSCDQQGGSTSEDVHISSPRVASPTKDEDSTVPLSQAPRDILAEIGRLALQLDCGQEEATSPMKQKVLEALHWSRQSDALPDDTYSEIPISLLQSPITKVLEDNSNLRRDLMQAKREVLRFKMEAQEQRIRMKELVGRQVTSHPTVPWNRKKVEMEKKIEDLESELLLARKAQKLYSRTETDKLRIKLVDAESRCRKTSKMDIELSKENAKLQEKIAELESVVERMENERYDQTLFEQKLYERLREEEETSQDLRTRLQHANEELDAMKVKVALARDHTSRDLGEKAKSSSEAGRRTPADATSTPSQQHFPHKSSPRHHTVSTPTLALQIPRVIAPANETNSLHLADNRYSSKSLEMHPEFYSGATEPSTKCVDEVRRAVAASMSTIGATSCRTLSRTKSAPLNAVPCGRTRSLSGETPALADSSAKQAWATSTSTGLRQPLLVRHKDLMRIANERPTKKPPSQESTVALPPEPTAYNSIHTSAETHHLSSSVRECSTERLDSDALYIQEQQEKFASARGHRASTASRSASMSRPPCATVDLLNVSRRNPDGGEDASQKNWPLTSSSPVLGRTQVDDGREHGHTPDPQNARQCVSERTTMALRDHSKQHEDEWQHHGRHAARTASLPKNVKEARLPPSGDGNQQLSGKNSLLKTNHFSFFHALRLSDF